MGFIAVALGICKLPLDLSWRHIFGAGLLGGIGFTMSRFVTNLAFVGQTELVTSSKMAIFLASLIAGVAGYLWRQAFGKLLASDDDVESMDFEQQP
jgi:NhaA family Na+:H+ antiporter